MSIDDVQFDVVDSGREPEPRRRAALAVLLVIVLVVAAGGWYLDRRSRQGEFAAVSRCVQRAAGEYRESTARISAMAEYVRPSLVFATEPTARGLYGMVADEAQKIGPGLQDARNGCAAIEVRAWHQDQRAALSAQLRLQDAQLALLARSATDGSAYYSDQDQISRLRTAAASALTAAEPGTPW